MSPQAESEQWRENSGGHPVNTRNAWQTALSSPPHHLASVASSCTIPFLVEVTAIYVLGVVQWKSLEWGHLFLSIPVVCLPSHAKFGNGQLWASRSQHLQFSIPELLVDRCLRWKEKRTKVLHSQQVPCLCPWAQFLGVALVRRLS